MARNATLLGCVLLAWSVLPALAQEHPSLALPDGRADNIQPGTEPVRRYVAAVRARPGITSVTLPVGAGLEVSRFEPG